MVQKLQKLKPSGGSALYDAIYMACTSRKLIQGEPIEPRRILVIVGDGHDNASKKTLDEALEIAQRNLVTIYGVSTVAFGFANDDAKNLVRLAEETGGRVEYPLEGVYKDVAGYLSTPSDEGNYALKVGTGQYAAETGERNVPRGGGRGGRSDHAVHHPLHPQCDRRQEAIPEHRRQGESGEREGAGQEGILSHCAVQ